MLDAGDASIADVGDASAVGSVVSEGQPVKNGTLAAKAARRRKRFAVFMV